MAWPSGRGPKGPFGFYRLQVIVTLCSQVPWRSIGGTTAPLSSIPFEADPLFPQHPGKELGEQRVSWPRGVERDPEGPESFKMSQRCSERPRKANKNLDSNWSSFSLFERMRCVANLSGANLHTSGTDCDSHVASKWTQNFPVYVTINIFLGLT